MRSHHRAMAKQQTIPGFLGISLPGAWRPFNDASPFNRAIADGTPTHVDSDGVIHYIVNNPNDETQHPNVRFANDYNIPLWVVDYTRCPKLSGMRSASVFDSWDIYHRPGAERVVDVPVPFHAAFYAEDTDDGHNIIVDPALGYSWEWSGARGLTGYISQLRGDRMCTTFNIWDLESEGVGDAREGFRSGARGGRGSGFPVIACLLRPESVEAGYVPHALGISFERAKDDVHIYPACRTDGGFYDHGVLPPPGMAYAPEGARMQLDPTLTDANLAAMGLSASARVVARAMQEFGVYLADLGGFTIFNQKLGFRRAQNRARWDQRCPGLYETIEYLPTTAFRILDEGYPEIERYTREVYDTRAVPPQIRPVTGRLRATDRVEVLCPVTSQMNLATVYTLDGSDPTPDSTRYTEPLALTAPCTVKAMSIQVGPGYHSIGEEIYPVERAPSSITVARYIA